MSAAQVVRAFEATVVECNGLGRALLERAVRERAPVAGSMLVRGPTIALGARQRASRVLDHKACALAEIPLARRATSGVHLSIGKRPAGVLALDATEDGAVLIELWIGQRESLALATELASDHERALDRWLGKSPSCWTESTGRAPLSLAQLDAVQSLALDRYGRASRVIERVAFEPLTVDEPDERWAWIAPVPCAIGALDAARIDEQTRWIGGDLLAGARAWAQLDRAAREERDARRSSIARCLRDELVLGVDAAAIEAAGGALDELAKVVRSEL